MSPRSVTTSCSVGRWRRACDGAGAVRRRRGAVGRPVAPRHAPAGVPRRARRHHGGRPATSPAGPASATSDLDDLVAANQVIDRYRRGDTVVLQGLHHTNPHLARLANNLALALDHPVQVNAYLSPSERARARPALRLPRRVRRAARRVQAMAGLGAAGAHDRPGEGPPPIAAPRFGGARRSAARHHDATPATACTCRAGYPHAAETVDRALGPPDDRVGGGDVAAGAAQGDRCRGCRGPADRRIARRAARAGRRGAASTPSASMACAGGSRPRPCVIGWRARSGAGNLRRACGLGSHRSLGSRRSAFTPGPLLWLTTIERPRRARARRSTARHARRGARLPVRAARRRVPGRRRAA